MRLTAVPVGCDSVTECGDPSAGPQLALHHCISPLSQFTPFISNSTFISLFIPLGKYVLVFLTSCRFVVLKVFYCC